VAGAINRMSVAWKAFWGLAALLVVLLTVTLVLMLSGGGQVTSDGRAEESSGGGASEADSLAYEQALREDSIESWNRFLAQFPASEHAVEAHRKLKLLEDREDAERQEQEAEEAFRAARDLDTLEAWQDFLNKYPSSSGARTAQERLTALQTEAESHALLARQEKAKLEDDAFSKAVKEDTIESWEGFVKRYPKSSRKSQATTRLEELRERERIPKEVTNSVGMRFRLIPAGEFTMGAVAQDRGAGDDEKPRHFVKITRPFYLGVYEVTQSQYVAVIGGSNPSKFNGSDRPIESVTWSEAMEFCRKISSREGVVYRLPTEAEWEYACRACSTTIFFWGDSMDDSYAWHADNSGNQTHPVGQKSANAWGLYDMSGNVCEWCSDWYGIDYYGKSESSDPQGPSSGRNRVIRGNAWNANPGILRTSFRLSTRPENRSDSIGFRVVMEVKQ
jgi:formylglycine-generating enzyme required for sulfatase activity